MSGTLREIKLLAMFIREFGSSLCEMETFLPEHNPLFQSNLEDLRLSVRRKGKEGYLFVNNYQRRYTMSDHLQEELKVEVNTDTIVYPPIDISNGKFFFLPFHMKVGDGELRSALATPLCVLNNSTQNTYIFYTDVNPAYCWSQEPMNTQVITISREEALHAWKVCKDKEYLLITTGDVVETDTGYEIINRHGDKLKTYPQLPVEPEGYLYAGNENDFSVYECCRKVLGCNLEYTLIREEADKKVYEFHIKYPEGMNDCFLRIDFGGDIAKLYVEQDWVDDWFYTGQTWEIGLKRFGFPSKVQVEIQALKENEQIFLEKWPEFRNGVACEIYHAEADVENVYQL
jgi:hypothetical protein